MDNSVKGLFFPAATMANKCGQMTKFSITGSEHQWWYNFWVMFLNERGVPFIVLFSLFVDKNKGMMAEVEIVILDQEMGAICWRRQSNKLEEAWISGC